ncbi:MAG: hypothetical protein FWC67_00850 [Defluviitaleaceae bacterium]|nr:hypothetical protein [Defluviitaleaceae bacterium]
MKKLSYSFVIIMTVIMLGFCAVVAVSVVNGRSGRAPQNDPIFEMAEAEYVAVAAMPAALPPSVLHHPDGIARISAGTVMIFDYYNIVRSDFDTITEHPSPFLINMTRAELAAMFADWHIVSFSPYEVHLRQNEALNQRHFIISAHNGFVAVFYDDDTRSIKELTTRSISALSQSEQQRLINGIHVTGNEELLRALEDFGS